MGQVACCQSDSSKGISVMIHNRPRLSQGSKRLTGQIVAPAALGLALGQKPHHRIGGKLAVAQTWERQALPSTDRCS